ncbi:hypothetical protein PSAC2689_220106 [Paraburkholderia sacchari]
MPRFGGAFFFEMRGLWLDAHEALHGPNCAAFGGMHRHSRQSSVNAWLRLITFGYFQNP